MVEESKIAETYKKASKFDKEELEKVEQFQKDYFDIQQAFGNLSIMRIKVKRQSEALDNAEKELNDKFGKIQEEERSFVDGITEKYGAGTLDVQTGEYSLK